jgi:hypothetical protein
MKRLFWISVVVTVVRVLLTHAVEGISGFFGMLR